MTSRYAGLVFLLACAMPAAAANVDMDIPYANFMGKDEEIFRENLDRALEKGADGVTVSWSNPETKARGEITPTKTFKRGESSCRTVTIANHAKGRSAKGPWTLCKDAAGKWQVAKAEAPPKKKPSSDK